jgi:ubiquinone/menaquinone biosynthesis C-methylase UbiE
MSLFDKRADEIEIMDDLNCAGPVVDQSLHELDVINQLLGGNAVTMQGMKRLLKHYPKGKPFHVADLGCGSGEMLRMLSKRWLRQYPGSQFTGIDANPNIVAYARRHVSAHPEIQIENLNILEPTFRRQSYDIVMATLFFHHFTSEQLVDIFRNLAQQARWGIVINDLHRHWFAYYSIQYLTRLLSKSGMVKADGPLSVRRGFLRAELEDILQKAGIKNYSLTWKWAFRWRLVIHTQTEPLS